MGEYSKFIAPERRSVATPKSIVDKDGKCAFGTFDKEFESMDFVKIKKPTCAPQCMNKLKLTLWEATEVNLKNGILLVACSDMALFGKILCVFYDKRSHKVYTWDNTLKSRDTIISDNLLDGAVTEAKNENASIHYDNNFDKGKARLVGKCKGKCTINGKACDSSDLEYDFNLERISLPCVVSIPFGKNRPLYSQKDFFKVVGKLTINGEEMLSDDDTTAIIDDHRGYYPRRAHYDWVTTMGRNVSGDNKYLAFNLTRNQSIDQDKYNENILWLEGKTSLLPPVTFTQSVKTRDFKKTGYTEWTVKDEHDMVNLKFKIYGINAMILHALVVKIDYYITFGEIEGYVRDEDGNKYTLDGMIGIGEDKSLLL